MGYLHLPNLGGMTKAVFSIWFRAPRTVIDTMIAQPNPFNNGPQDGSDQGSFYPPLQKIIPLITFGGLQAALTGEYPIQPSFIGLDCTGPTSYGAPNSYIYGKSKPTLAVNLQTNGRPAFSHPPVIPSRELRPYAYYMQGIGSDPYYGTNSQDTMIDADLWHHALVSFDIGHACGLRWRSVDEYTDTDRWSTDPVRNGPVFSWALNDVSKVGKSMSPAQSDIWNFVAPGATGVPPRGPDDPHYIIPMATLFNIEVGGDVFDRSVPTSPDFDVSCSGDGIPAGPVGIPSSSEFASNVQKVEIAHCQVYTDTYLDFADQANRRLFIDSNGEPVEPSAAITAIGKPPEIAFLGADDWQTGTNTGSAGNFTPTGTIRKFSPNPKVGS